MKKIIFTLLFLPLIALAEIRESFSILDVAKEARPGDVVVFDIDNTILEPTQTLGSVQWYDDLIQEKVPEHQALAKFTLVQRKTSTRLVDPHTAKAIGWFQAKNIPVFALTARPIELAEVSPRQLLKSGVDLSVTAPSDLQLPVNDVVYHRGVLSVGAQNNKGVVLRETLKLNRIQPRRVLFIDDKANHVANMEKALQGEFININFRFGVADARVRSFNRNIAKTQWAHFVKTNEILSDEEALKFKE